VGRVGVDSGVDSGVGEGVGERDANGIIIIIFFFFSFGEKNCLLIIPGVGAGVGE
jgi:hypothetical protein